MNLNLNFNSNTPPPSPTPRPPTSLPNPKAITTLYNKGYLYGRRHKGDFYQARSVRIKLKNFQPSSENRRILRKNKDLNLQSIPLPLPNYTWQIHKLGKDFYETKFGAGIMSANKLKSMFTNPQKNNMTLALKYTLHKRTIGYCLCYMNKQILHYTYPFYELSLINKTIGIGMMTKAIIWGKQQGFKFVYLGGYTDNKSRYKLQFSGWEIYNLEQKIWQQEKPVF